jgi:Flp pilus assembly secretin CpaC
MRALSVVSNVIFIFSCAITVQAQPPAAPNAAQGTGCPTVLPVAEGERSIVVPTVAPNVVAPHVEPPAQQPPHIASRPQSPQHEAAKSLLREKLAQRDQLQREIAALRESTQTPEQISVQVKMVEINRTKLRKLGVDWSTFNNGQPTQTDLAGLLGTKPAAASTTAPGVSLQTNVDPAVLEIITALERQNVTRVLAMPTVVMTSGRPASLNIGTDLPIPDPAAPGGVRVEKCGTQVDLTAVSLGDNRVRIDVRPRVSEINAEHAVVVNGAKVPAISVRQLDTSLEMEFGKTTIMSGMVQQRKAANANWLGRENGEVEEIALMLIVTPQIVR